MAAELMEPLAKELSCPICLSLMTCPVARLPCCHYFCQECITVSVRHKAACPVCKAKVGRRDIAADPTMDRVISAFLNLHDLTDQLLRHPDRLQADQVSGDGHEAIFWLQGVEDEELNSPSRTMSGSALERLRRQRGVRRAASPPTVHNSHAAASRHVADTAAQAAATVAEGSAPVEAAVEAAPVLAEQAPTAGEESGGSLKENRHAAAKFAPPEAVAAGQQPPPGWKGKGPTSAAAQRQAAAKNKRQSEGTQSIQRWMKRAGPAADEAGPSPPRSVAATATKIAPASAAAGGSKGPTSGDEAAGEASQASSLAPEGARDAAKQLDNILAGLGDGGETPPPLQASAPQSHAVPAAPTGAAVHGGAKGGAAAAGAAVTRERKGRSSGDGGSGSGSRKRSASLAPGEGRGERRRIPTRLLPWSCGACTFENKGGETKCGVCGIKRGPGSANIAAPEAAAAAAAEQQRQRGEGTGAAAAAPDAAEADASGRPAGEAAQRQGQQAGREAAKRSKLAPVAPAAVEPAGSADAESEGSAAWRGGKAKWVLLGSALDSAGKERLRRLAAASGSTVADKWGPRVTHVVCGTSRRTFKLLMGLLAGKWVVSEEWASACLAARSAVPEERHSVQEEGQAGREGARRGRTAGGAGAKLLCGFEVVLEEAFSRPEQVKELLTAAGARVLPKLPAGGKGKGKGAAVVLVEVPDTSEAAAAGFRRSVAGQAWYARACGAGVAVLSKSWLTDSINALEVRPVQEYRV